MKWRALLAALIMGLLLTGCTVVHVHIGDTQVDAEADVGYTVPTPKLVIPTE